MKTRFVHQYFHPDLSSVFRVISEIAFALAASGHEVSVIFSWNEPDGTLRLNFDNLFSRH